MEGEKRVQYQERGSNVGICRRKLDRNRGYNVDREHLHTK